MKIKDTVKVKGEIFDIMKSNRKNKQLVARSRRRKLNVHFGSPKYPEKPGTKTGDNYCSRSFGISKKYKTFKDVKSPNFWSRWYLWNCNMDKSLKNRPKLK